MNLMRKRPMPSTAPQLHRSDALYVPGVHRTRREHVLVMERIYGIPVSDIPALEANGPNMKLLAERGVDLLHPVVP